MNQFSESTQWVEAMMLELIQASSKHGAFPTKMHGYAVILEELDEAWHEIKHGSVDKAKEELIQVAAMCIRFCMDL